MRIVLSFPKQPLSFAPSLQLLFIHISINLKFVIRTLLFDVEIIDFSRLSYLNSVYSIRYFLKSFLLNRDVYKE